MVSRRNRKIAPKRLGRKQTKKNWFQKLMYGGVVPNEEQKKLSATIEKNKEQLREILAQIPKLKQLLSNLDTSDETKPKITDAIDTLMKSAHDLKDRIKANTNELKTIEAKSFAELEAEVNKEFENPFGFSAARAKQSVVGSMAQVKEAMRQGENLVLELEGSKASVSAGPTQLTKVPGASGTAPKQTKVNIDKLKKRLELITDIIGEYEEKKKQGELAVDRRAEIDKRIKELTYDKQQTESLLKTNTIAENTMKILATRKRIAELTADIAKRPQNKIELQELQDKLKKFKEALDKYLEKQTELTQSGGTLKKHRKSKLHRKHRRTIKY